MLAGTFSAAPSVSDTPFGKPGPSGLTEVTALQVTEVSVEYSWQSVWVFFFFLSVLFSSLFPSFSLCFKFYFLPYIGIQLIYSVVFVFVV